MMTRHEVGKKKNGSKINRKRWINSIENPMKQIVNPVQNHREEVRKKKKNFDVGKKHQAGIVLPPVEYTNILTDGGKTNNRFYGEKKKM